MAHFAVSAIGRDRPGIVAALAEALLELDGNIEDSRMTILRGQFAVMLIVTLPDPVGRSDEEAREQLESRLQPVAGRLGLDAVAVSPVGEMGTAGVAASHVITVYGADHPGIVHSISAELAARGVNITDLQTKLSGDPGSPLYVMLLEVALGDAGAEEIGAALESVGEQAGVEVSLGEIDSEAL